ncbi:MAG: sugar phosphate isomerase/epimerase [Armatimonadetes bacterium]|nr:sugar phosphate isomerase/epimerase [Armatimonadota bacterium]
MRLSLVVSLGATTFEAVAMREGFADLERVAALGFDGVELAVRDPAEVEGAALAERCAGLGLPVAALGTGQAYLHEGLSLTSPAAGIRRAASERLRQHIRLASMLNEVRGAPSSGVQVIVGLLRGQAAEAAAGAAGREQAEGRLREALEAVLAEADAGEVGLAIEPINRYETDFLNTAAECVAVIERIGHRRLGLVADTFHMNIEEVSIEAGLRAAAPHLRHVHVADSNRRPPGQGHLDFRSILSALRDAGYDGYLSAETLPLPTSEDAARLTVSHLRPMLAEVEERRRIS